MWQAVNVAVSQRLLIPNAKFCPISCSDLFVQSQFSLCTEHCFWFDICSNHWTMSFLLFYYSFILVAVTSQSSTTTTWPHTSDSFQCGGLWSFICSTCGFLLQTMLVDLETLNCPWWECMCVQTALCIPTSQTVFLKFVWPWPQLLRINWQMNS